MSTNIFPKQQYNVEVCNHRWDKKMTYCENSDTLSNNNYMPLILWFMRNNIKVGVFQYVTNAAQMKIAKQLELCGIVNNSLYCTMGVGNQRTMNENAKIMRNLFKKYIMRYPSTYSYAGSDETYYRSAAKSFNGARDNDYGDFGHPYTFYGNNFQTQQLLGSLEVPVGGGSPEYPERTGYNRYDEMKHFMSMRWCDEATGGKYQHGYTVAQCIEKLIDDVQTTYGLNGFYNAFCHWHNLGGSYNVTKLQYKDYIDALAGIQVGGVSIADNIHFCGFDEAIEYMVARIMLQKISCYTPVGNPDQVHIVGYFNNKVAPRFVSDSINTPLTIKVDLTGTPLEGKGIASSYGQVMNLGNNVFLVELPAPRNGNISGVILSEIAGSDFIITTPPTITATVSGNQISFSAAGHLASAMHFILFKKAISASEDTAVIADYQHEISSLTITKEDGYEYCVGVTANYGNGHYVVSSVSNWY